MAVTFRKFIKGILLRGEISDASDNLEGSLFHNSSDMRVKAYIEGAVRQVVTNSQSQALTNKTINADSNNISELETDNLKSGVLNVSTALASASNTQIPSALAVKGYVDSSISTAQTLTNKTINADNNTITNLETDNLKSGVLNVSTTLSSASDTQIPSALAVKTYIDNGLSGQNQASEISYSNSTSGLSATDVQGAIDALDNDVDNLITLTGVARDSVNLGTFSGSTIGATSTIKQALQNLELAVESSGGGGASSTSFNTSPEVLVVGNPVYLSSVGTVSLANSTPTRKNFYGFVKTVIPGVGPNTFLENFESGNFSTNSWTVVNGAQTNQFFVGTATSFAGTYSAYISNDGGVSNAYTTTATSVVWFYKDITLPATSQNLSFQYKLTGESSFDSLRVIIDPTLTVIPVAGTNIFSTPSGGSNTRYNSTSNVWTQGTTGLSSYAGTTVRIIFGWENDSFGGSQTPVAIDNISIDPAPTYEVQYDGIFTAPSGSLTPNTIYNLSSSGGLTSAAATTGNFTVPVGMALSSNSILINQVAAAGVTAVGSTSSSSFLSTVSIINTSPYTVVTADLGELLLVDTSTGAKTINLPTSPTTGFSIVIKDYKGNSAANAITVTKSASHTIEQLNSSYICEASFGSWTFIYDGSNNWVIL